MKRILFGAGKIGNKAADNEELLKADEIYFCDNYKMRDRGIKFPIISFEKLKEIYDDETEIIITTAYYNEIYYQCRKYGMKVTGIYDEKANTVKDLYHYCKDNYKDYSNYKYMESLDYWEQKINRNVELFLRGEQLSNCLTGVAIMISNVCNYAHIHTKCPAHEEKEKQIMSFHSIRYIVDELERIGFSGKIMFHIYNEPMNDPRLFSIIRYVREKLENATIVIYTNGFYLTDVIVRELEEATVNILITTAYGNKEYDRLMQLNPTIAYHIHYGILDERINYYEKIEPEFLGKSCRSLISQLDIYVNGDIGLCCLDYRHSSEMGNVFKEGFEVCVNNEKIRRFQTELLNGKRTEKLCQGCGWQL